MSDRYFALTVSLSRDIRDDDAACIIEAIKMIKGVATVKPLVADAAFHVAELRARNEARSKLREITDSF